MFLLCVDSPRDEKQRRVAGEEAEAEQAEVCQKLQGRAEFPPTCPELVGELRRLLGNTVRDLAEDCVEHGGVAKECKGRVALFNYLQARIGRGSNDRHAFGNCCLWFICTICGVAVFACSNAFNSRRNASGRVQRPPCF